MLAEVELEDEEELATFTLYSKSLNKKAIKHVDPEDNAEDEALIASLVKQISAANVSADQAGAQAEAILADEDDEAAEEEV